MINVTINEEQVAELVSRGMWDSSLHDRIEERVNQRVDEAVDAKARELVEAEVTRRVAEQLEQGFQQTDQWGSPRGARVTLAQMVADYFDKEIEVMLYDRRHRVTRARQILEELLSRQLDKEFKKQLDEASKQIRDAVDGLIKEKLTATLKSALGL